MEFVISVLPVFLTIAIGFGLMQTRLVPREHWAGIEALSFRLLIPAVLIVYIARTDLDLAAFGPMTLAIFLALALAGAVALLARSLPGMASLPGTSIAVLFQTTVRWNAFIALAAAEFFQAPLSLTLIAVAMAVMVPVINIASIAVLATYGPATIGVRALAMTMIKNPLVQASLIGVALNLLGVRLDGAIGDTLDLIGRAAFGIGLLAVGAGLDPGRLIRPHRAVWLALLLRLVLAPLTFLAFAGLLELGPEALLAGLLVLSVPAASNGYVVTKAMGGNAELYADTLAWQTLCSMLLLPMVAAYALGG